MNMLKYFWNNPYPESILRPILFKLDCVFSPWKRKTLPNKKYRIQCIFISVLALSILFFISGVQNPLIFFVDIPILDINEFATIVEGNENVLLIYMIMGSATVAFGLYLIRLFLFHGKEYKFFSINGILFSMMTVFVSAVIDFLFKKVTYIWFLTTEFPNDSMSIPGLIVLGVVLNFTLYFVLEDTFMTITASYCAIWLLIFFQDYFMFIVPARLVSLLLLTFLIKVVLWLLTIIKIWPYFANLCKKWFYTPKYIFKMTMIIFTIGLALALPNLVKKQKDR